MPVDLSYLQPADLEIFAGRLRKSQAYQIPPSVRPGFVEDEVREGYDFARAVGRPLTNPEHWTDDSKWWYSELTFATVLAGGTRLLDPAVMKRMRSIDCTCATTQNPS